VIIGRRARSRIPTSGGMRAFTNRIVPGRWEELRPVTAQELLGTSVLVLPIEEASAKIRTGPPVDDEEDLEWPVWAGVVPLALQNGDPVPDTHVRPGTEPPDPARLGRRGQIAD
jgi:hypothetical protein